MANPYSFRAEILSHGVNNNFDFDISDDIRKQRHKSKLINFFAFFILDTTKNKKIMLKNEIFKNVEEILNFKNQMIFSLLFDNKFFRKIFKEQININSFISNFLLNKSIII